MLRRILVRDFDHFQTRRPAGLSEYPFGSALTRLRGQRWKHVRSLITPAFSTAKLRLITSHIRECASILVDNLREPAFSDRPVRMKEHCGAFTMDVIARSAFGFQLNSKKQEHHPFVQNANKFFRVLSFMNPIALMLLVFPFTVSLLKKLPLRIMPKDAIEFFVHIIDDILESRRQSKETHVDFLQLMIDAETNGNGVKQNGDHNSNHVTSTSSHVTQSANQEAANVHSSNIPQLTARGLSKEEIHAQALIFFIAGYETSATTLSFFAYSLATNQDCQMKLIEEIDEISKAGCCLEYEHYCQLPYLDQCLSETLRLYPPAVRTTRVCSRDVQVGRVVVQRGMLVAVPVYHLHTDPDVWPDPLAFRPERFSASARAGREAMAYLPFGAGPRRCLGVRLALLELKVAAVHLLQSYTLHATQSTQIPMVFKKKGLLQPEKDIILKLVPRKRNIP